MTLKDLEALIDSATWFARCGEFSGAADAVPLSAVASAGGWDWLPTSRDQPDPVHGGEMVVEADAAGLHEARREAELAAVRRIWHGMRATPNSVPALVDGPHDFTWAAKGGAEFAARMAVREVIVGRPGLWCRVMQFFAAGYWPCGMAFEDQRIVVL